MCRPEIQRSYFLLPALMLILTVAVLPGCSHRKIKPLDFEVISVDVDKGIELLLITRDKQGNSAAVEGTVGVKLWYYTRTDYYDIKEDNRLVQEWNDIPLTNGDYSTDSGASIFLPYDKPHHSQGAVGLIEVTLETFDGRLLVYERDGIQISSNIDYPQ
jgi:hypothetical protein